MAWTDYLSLARRRWWTLGVVILLDVLVSGYLYRRDTRGLGYQACTTLYVADVGAPSLISAPPTSLAAEGALLAGETAANFFGDDIVDVSESQRVAAFVAQRLRGAGLPHTSEADINGAVTGSRRDRTLSLCATNPAPESAEAIATQVGVAMTANRAMFFGQKMARRTFVDTVSNASVAPVSSNHARTSFLLRLLIGLLVAGALALLMEALDPRLISARQIESAVSVPVVVL